MSYETFQTYSQQAEENTEHFHQYSEHFNVMWHFLCWSVPCFSAVSGRAKQELFFQYLALTNIFLKQLYYIKVFLLSSKLLFNHDDWQNNSTVHCLPWAVKMLVWTSNSILYWCYGTMRFVTIVAKFTITYSTPLKSPCHLYIFL